MGDKQSKLASAPNNDAGDVTLLFNEPPDAKKPDERWRLRVVSKLKKTAVEDDDVWGNAGYMPEEGLPSFLPVDRKSCYLFGKERKVADVCTSHGSCSDQHAVLQFREVENAVTKPYVMDLGSTNGTFLNGNRIDSERYYELSENDNLKFGNSSREYVLIKAHA